MVVKASDTSVVRTVSIAVVVVVIVVTVIVVTPKLRMSD